MVIMIGVKAILFVIMSLINVCKIEEPATENVQFSQGLYGEGSLVWTFDDGIVDNSFIILELMHKLEKYQQHVPSDHNPQKGSTDDEPLYVLARSNCSLPGAVDIPKGTHTSAPAVTVHTVPEPCQPRDDPGRNGDKRYHTMLPLPFKSMVCGLVVFENLLGFLMLSMATSGQSQDELSSDKETRTVAMLEGRVVESLPSEKLSDDSCVIVNLSPSSSQDDLSDDDHEEPFEIVNI